MRFKRLYLKVVLSVILIVGLLCIVVKTSNYIKSEQQQKELKQELQKLKKFKKCTLITTEALFENCREL